ncbi:Gfo/Idh/MocA family protein [Phytoactinopolyspora limicola]|uniref:Gfo/Idh/MocA family protein n=1 Tax=Phytoactinopolyspora limicola TaxID=2715536 RepID=UPI00140B4AD4|nr:Gfo/Idh/MocA family oxidoreductase [Phytoactinopolyspora limicola]
MRRTKAAIALAVGIIGPGAIAEHHVAAIRAAGADVVCVAGPDPTDFAARHNIRSAYRDVDDLLLHPGLDAVVVASPNDLHARHTIAALQAGFHVLCEVPAATTMTEAQDVDRTARLVGKHVSVAQTLRFCSPFRAVRDRIDAGTLRVRHLILHQLLDRRTNTGVDGRARDWTDNVVWHHGSHLVDVGLWLLGTDEATVHGTAGRAAAASPPPLDAAAVLATPAGDLATIAISYRSRVPCREAHVIGDEATLRIRHGSLFDGERELIVGSGDSEMERRALQLQDREFLSALADGRRPPCSISELLATYRLLDKIQAADNDPHPSREET